MMLVSILGSERPDIAFYIYTYLQRTRKALLVVDNSLQGSLFFSRVGDYSRNQEHVLEFGNMVLARGIGYDSELMGRFDYVVLFNGMAEPDEFVAASDQIFLLPDYHTYTICRMKGFVRMLKKSAFSDRFPQCVHLVMRDIASEKITDDAIVKELGVAPECMCGVITDDISDHALEIALEWGGLQRMRGHSRDYVSALVYLLCVITGDKSSAVKKKLLKL